ncbi:MAG: hypothetical protein IJT59_07990, partial [Desulfovibrionaceae bacterium]|nr:hypothetical protein [Desulfovibrionaceae bacterium]
RPKHCSAYVLTRSSQICEQQNRNTLKLSPSHKLAAATKITAKVLATRFLRWGLAPKFESRSCGIN